MAAETEGVLAAARAIRWYLPGLLGADASRVDEQISALLNNPGPAEETADQLQALLSRQTETRMFLRAVLRDKPRYRPLGEQIAGAAKPRGFQHLPGIGDPPPPPRFHCPVGDDYDWYRPGVGTPIPRCPTHHCPLVLALGDDRC